MWIRQLLLQQEAQVLDFQSDRRLIRLLIARYWADVFQKLDMLRIRKKEGVLYAKTYRATTTVEANGS
jgi:outer membrane protein TolC